MVGDVQDVVSAALGGEAVTTTVEGRERYTVNVRYPRDLRSISTMPLRRCEPACREGRAPPLTPIAPGASE